MLGTGIIEKRHEEELAAVKENVKEAVAEVNAEKDKEIAPLKKKWKKQGNRYKCLVLFLHFLIRTKYGLKVMCIV